jgi:hypothetical protein
MTARLPMSTMLNENPSGLRHDWRVEVFAISRNQLKRARSRRQADCDLGFAVAEVNDLIADGQRLVQRTRLGMDEKMMMSGIENRCRSWPNRYAAQSGTFGERRKNILSIVGVSK